MKKKKNVILIKTEQKKNITFFVYNKKKLAYIGNVTVNGFHERNNILVVENVQTLKSVNRRLIDLKVDIIYFFSKLLHADS